MKENSLKRYILLTFFLCASAAAAEPSDAGGWVEEIKFGILWHDVDGLWSGCRKEEGLDYNVEVLFSPAMSWLGGVLRPAVGASINSSADTSKLYADGRWRYSFDNPGYLVIGFGFAVHNGETDDKPHSDTKALGSRVLFHTVIEYGFDITPRGAISLFFDHVSNAGFNDDNQGLDTLGVRFSHRF